MTKRSKRNPSRSLGVKLWDKDKNPFVMRNYPPGQHGTSGYKRPTDYGTQLKAKQTLKKYYCNITEKQFRRIFNEALRRSGDTGQNLVGLLESRLDAFVYRSKFAKTMYAARQLISHKHLTVNGVTVNIASYTLKPGDVVEIRPKAKDMPIIKESMAITDRNVPEYVAVNKEGMSSTYIRIPSLDETPYPIQMQPQLVVEFYSR